MEGISSLQGLHQVAQKLRKMTFPLNWFNPSFLPFKSFKEKSGVFLSPLIGVIPIFEKRSSSLPSAWTFRLRKRTMTKKKWKKIFPLIIFFYNIFRVYVSMKFYPSSH